MSIQARRFRRKRRGSTFRRGPAPGPDRRRSRTTRIRPRARTDRPELVERKRLSEPGSTMDPVATATARSPRRRMTAASWPAMVRGPGAGDPGRGGGGRGSVELMASGPSGAELRYIRIVLGQRREVKSNIDAMRLKIDTPPRNLEGGPAARRCISGSSLLDARIMAGDARGSVASAPDRPRTLVVASSFRRRLGSNRAGPARATVGARAGLVIAGGRRGRGPTRPGRNRRWRRTAGSRPRPRAASRADR